MLIICLPEVQAALTPRQVLRLNPINTRLLHDVPKEYVVLLDQVLRGLYNPILEYDPAPVLHSLDDLCVASGELDLLAQDVLEVLEPAIAIMRFGLIRRRKLDLLMIQLFALTAHIEKDVREVVLQLCVFIVL